MSRVNAVQARALAAAGITSPQGQKVHDQLQAHMTGQMETLTRLKSEQQKIETHIRDEAKKAEAQGTPVTSEAIEAQKKKDKRLKELNSKLVSLQKTMESTQNLYEQNMRLQVNVEVQLNEE